MERRNLPASELMPPNTRSQDSPAPPAPPPVELADKEVDAAFTVSIPLGGPPPAPMVMPTGRPGPAPRPEMPTPRPEAPVPNQEERFRALAERLERHEAVLLELRQMLRYLCTQAAKVEPELRQACTGLTQQCHQLQRDLDAERLKSEELGRRQRDLEAEKTKLEELSRRHQETLKQLALREREAALASAAKSVPQHDQLVQAFRRLKTHTFERLAQAIYQEWDRVRAPQHPPPDPQQDFAEIKRELTRVILAGAWEHLRTGTAAAADQVWLEEHLFANFRELLFQNQIPEAGVAALNLPAAVQESVKLLADMTAARPPALLLLAPEGEPFDPDRHEAARGCLDKGNAHVSFTIFPGYVIDSPPKVIMKAEVFTGVRADG